MFFSRKSSMFLIAAFNSFVLLLCHFYLSGFDGLLTPAEKAKLYTAIGYSETAANPNLPKKVGVFWSTSSK